MMRRMAATRIQVKNLRPLQKSVRLCSHVIQVTPCKKKI